MAITRKYWKGIDELKETPAFLEAREQEFPTQVSVDEFLGDENLKETSTGRRDFLKFLGFSVAAATVAACEAPVTKAIPYVNKPENVTPGLATWYASTFYDGNSYASILVKTREGRPIFIKGNRDHGITNGATNPQIVASVLGLYDNSRLKFPMVKGQAAKPSDLDKGVMDGLKKAKSIALVTNSVHSPSMIEAINKLRVANGATETMTEMGPMVEGGKIEHIQYDAISYAGMREANLATFGSRILPDYDFSKAKTIIGIGADFLSTWLMPTRFAPQYGLTRNPDAEWMSKHFQFESNMSVTGSNADERAMIKPSEQANVLAYLLNGMGVKVAGVSSDLSIETKAIADDAIKSLKKSKSESIVVCGSNSKEVQILTNKLNNVLGAYNKTINLNNEINMFKSNDTEMNTLVKDVIAGKGPEAIIFYGVNPVYTLPNGEEFGKALEKVTTTVAISTHQDETAECCQFISADHHSLETWMDYNPTKAHYALAQPTIRPLHSTASAMETLLVWAGQAKRGGKDSKVAYDFIHNNWVTYGFPNQTEYADAHTYWSMMVHNSCSDFMYVAPTELSFNDSALSGIGSKLPKGGELEVVVYQKASIGNGSMSNNPWLQEMPDPITKVTWDNYITMNPIEMEKEGLKTTFDQENGLNKMTLTVNGKSITLPVYPVPGQAPGTVGVALGYGRGSSPENVGAGAFRIKEYGGVETDENGNPVAIGANAYAFTSMMNGTMCFDAVGSKSKAEGVYLIAATQIHGTAMGRNSVVRETTLDIYKKADSKEAYNHTHTISKMDKDGNHVATPISEFDLWDEHPVEKIGHRWGMTIDLSSCIGCGTCLIACQSENNIPVVGKDEVRRGREMHWLRIDRYFASDIEAAVGTRKEHDKSKMDFFEAAEIASLNPKVVHMPMMCHHCNHAPCETVCPVAATTHSNEGLNQMAYNRCIGTRYCANNCPYKVRRFNWFNYPSYKMFTEINPAQDDLGRMVLNPDVTVRTRGVMEKCTFCVQRIQEGKLNAKAEGRPVVDGDYVSACADACPTKAITVGDWNDLKSMVRKSADDNRAYLALEEVGTKPNVWFKVKVRNEENKELEHLQMATAHHGGTEAKEEKHH